MNEIFKPKINHKINNNRNTYYSFIEENNKKEIEKIEEPIDVLNRLIKENSYIFNKKVLIKTSNKEYLTKIAGKINNRIITINGEEINIDDVIKIEEK